MSESIGATIPREDSAPVRMAELLPGLRVVGWEAPWGWLKAGIADYRACLPAASLFGFCFAACGWLLYAVLSESTAVFAALLTGFLLVGPALCLGLYELSRQREADLPPDLLRAVFAFRGRLQNIGLLSSLLGVVLLLWGRASMVVFIVFYTRKMPSFEGFLAAFTEADKLDFVVTYLCVGGVFAALVFGFSVIAIPLMLDRNVDAVTAALVSLKSVMDNPMVMMAWAGVIVAAVLVGFVTGFLGLIVIGPILGHASWHAYRGLLPRT